MKNLLVWCNYIAKNSDKKWEYSDYVFSFDGKGEWNFGNDSARNIEIFGIDNSSSSHTDGHKNYFLVLGEEDTFGISGNFGALEISLVLILVKQRQNDA